MAGAIFIVGFRLAVMLLGIAVTAYIARLTDPQSFGQYSLLMALFSILTIPLQHSMPTYIVKTCSGEKKGIGKIENELGVILFFYLVSFLCAGIIVSIIALLYDYTWLFVMVFLVAYIAVGLNVGIRGGLATAFFKPIMGSPIETFFRNVFFFLIAFLFLGKASDHEYIFLLYTMSAMLSLVTCFLVSKRLLKGIKISYIKIRKPTRTDCKLFFTFALLGGIFVVNANLDQMIIGLLSGSSDVAIYRVAVLAATAVSFVFSSLSLIAAPYFSSSTSLIAERKGVELARLCFFITLLLFIFYVGFGQRFIVLAMGGYYKESFIPGAILILSLTLNAALGYSGLYLNLNGNEKFVLFAAAASVLLNGFLNMLFIPLFSVQGAAVATLLSSFFWKMILLIKVRHVKGLKMAAFNKVRK